MTGITICITFDSSINKNTRKMKTITKTIEKVIEKCASGSTLFINEGWTKAQLFNDETDETHTVSISVCSQIQNHPHVQMQMLPGFFSGSRGYKVVKK